MTHRRSADFPVGSEVQVSESALNGFLTNFQPKIRKRLGVVMGISCEFTVLVHFAAAGRRKELRHDFHVRNLELVAPREADPMNTAADTCDHSAASK
jgi:hypothetical protein